MNIPKNIPISLCFCLLLALLHKAKAENVNVLVQSDLRHDVLDYDEDKKETFVRGKVKIITEDELTLDYCEIKRFSTGNRSRTGSLYVKNIKDYLDFIVGNYNLNFGSGLIMGKKVYMPADPFRSRLAVAKSKPLSPSSGGNPAYSFFGSATRLHYIFDETEISLLPFYSIQKRYITLSDEDDGAVISSITGLDSRTQPDDTHRVPVNVINTGGLFSLNIQKIIIFQAFLFRTDLKHEVDKDILWDLGKEDSSNGTDFLNSAGCFLQYADNNVCIFIEPALSHKENDKSKNAYAAQWGFNLRSKYTRLSYTGKKTGENFYSPYSSGGNNPESLWQILLSVLPSQKTNFGVSFYEERNLSPTYNSSYIEGTRREGIYGSFKPLNFFTINLKVRRLSHYSEEYKDSKIQASGDTSLSGERLFLKMKYIAQNMKNEKLSDIFSIECKYLFLRKITFMAGWTKIRISEDNKIYGTIPPASDATASGKLFSSSGQAYALKLKYKEGKNFASARFCVTDIKEEKEKKFESALGFLF